MECRRAFPMIVGFVVIAFGAGVSAETTRPSDLAACRQWFDRVFSAAVAPTPGAYMEIVSEDVGDAVTRGKSWRGTPYQLGPKTYAHGIAFNATKHIRVHLAQPGERFSADVGLENNDDTQRGAALGKGSVTFHVLIGKAGTPAPQPSPSKGEGMEEVFHSPVMRLADGWLAVDVPLKGATEFELRVGDAGDGRAWDQALWGEAVVHLRDGSVLRLQDLPWAESVLDCFGFSFVYSGEPSRSFLGGWQREAADLSPEPAVGGAPAGGTELLRRRVTYRDPHTGLEVRVDAVLLADFPAVEWVVHLKNAGTADTPILEDIQATDTVLALPGAAAPVLHWAKGGVATFDDFAPQETPLGAGAKLRLQPGGGRSSSQVLPFFNLAGSNGGVIAAVGWTGEWAAQFAGTAGGARLKAGLAQTHLRLHPGEEIRTPRMCLLFYEGDRWRGQNLWRRFVLTHHRPQHDGRPLVAPITCGNWGGTSAEIHLDNIRQIAEHNLPIEYYWIDAEWFGQAGSWYPNAGDWKVKADLYPQGFRPLSAALQKTGRELMLWFEPERVYKGTPWHQKHRDWLLDVNADSLLWNLGQPEARKFLTDFISARIDEFGLGCYRQDFNIDPLRFWQAADAPDRQGLTEIRYIEGLYAFWDELLARHPGLIIDNCASGGRRLDLETLGRATPLWRTDGPRDPIAHQGHTYGLLPWVPLSSTSQDRAGDDYEFRSSMCSALCLNWWVTGDVPAERIRPDFPFDWCQRTLEQYLRIRRFYYGDYYPLTKYSQAADLWLAYQLDLPETGEGLLVVLRRPESPYEKARFKLHGLAADAKYEFADLDQGHKRTLSGETLTKSGLEVSVESSPGSALLLYKRTGSSP